MNAKNTASNPVYRFAIQDTGWPSPRQAWIVGLIIINVFTLLALWNYIRDPMMEINFTRVISWVIIGLATVLAFLIPLWLAIWLVLITQRQFHSEAFQLVKMTGIEPSEITKGFRRSAFYRTRLVWVAAFALFPPVLLTVAHQGVMLMKLSYEFDQMGVPFNPWRELTSMMTIAFPLTLVIFVAASIFLLYSLLMAVNVGMLVSKREVAIILMLLSYSPIGLMVYEWFNLYSYGWTIFALAFMLMLTLVLPYSVIIQMKH